MSSIKRFQFINRGRSGDLNDGNRGVIKARDRTIFAKEQVITAKDREITEKNNEIYAMNLEISSKEQIIKELKRELEDLRAQICPHLNVGMIICKQCSQKYNSSL